MPRSGGALAPLRALLLTGFVLGGCECGGAGAAPPDYTRLRLEVLRRVPHDTSAWTQGLAFDEGRLYEGTGLLGESSLREIDPANGEVLRRVALPDTLFGEGVATLPGKRLLQLSWKSGRAIVWRQEPFSEERTFSYEGEGWGACTTEAGIWQSDGTALLRLRDPSDFRVLREVEVRSSQGPVTRLNELECAQGAVYANIWQRPELVRINIETGRVEASLDARTLEAEARAAFPGAEVMNGIAFDEGEGVFWLTGKYWPMYAVVKMEAEL